MRQQFSCFFTAFFIALFLTFSLLAHSQPYPLSETEQSPASQYASPLTSINNNVSGECLALLKTNEPNSTGLIQATDLPDYQVEPFWFHRLYQALAVLKISYQNKLNSRYKHQQHLTDNMSELSLLILGITSPLYADTSAQPLSFYRI